MDEIYEKNLDAIKKNNPFLFDKLVAIKENIRFEVFQGKTLYDINILDTENDVFLYNTPLQDISDKIAEYQIYQRYDFLYFYGIGNGLIYRMILDTFGAHLQQIVVFESDIELLFIALNMVDFSKEIDALRFVIVCKEQLDYNQALQIFSYRNAKFYAKVFDFHVTLDYYTNYHAQEVTDTNKILLKAIEHHVLSAGNDIIDSLVGVDQHIKHLGMMVEHPSFSQLKGQKNSDIAVVVATGPSLHKQLELLKKVEDKVTIISVDASMPILYQHGIKPDICVTMERDEPTSTFFKNLPDDFQQEVIFLTVSLQHATLFQAITSKKLVVAMRPFFYNNYFELHDYGYVCTGMSSANMAHELAFQMGFEKCVLIGQDLAYAKDGKSHSKGHVFGEDEIENGFNKVTQKEEEIVELDAYGGEGKVKSTIFWKLFKYYFEKNIGDIKHLMTTYNATEGGARIEGSIEVHFKEVMAPFLEHESKSELVLTYPTKKSVDKNLKKIKKKITQLLDDSEQIQKTVEETFLFIEDRFQPIENMSREEVLEYFSDEEVELMLKKVNDTRDALQDNETFTTFYLHLVYALLMNYEMELAKIKVKPIYSQVENKENSLKWIHEHRYWFFSLAGIVDNIRTIVKNNSTYLFE